VHLDYHKLQVARLYQGLLSLLIQSLSPLHPAILPRYHLQ